MNGRVASIGATHPELTLFIIRQNRPATVGRVSQAVLPRRAQRGSGLGLAIVRSIAERHAGKVWLESQLGQGSTIFLLIPYEQPEGTKQEQNRL
jgi:signal transduction histidine kinase